MPKIRSVVKSLRDLHFLFINIGCVNEYFTGEYLRFYPSYKKKKAVAKKWLNGTRDGVCTCRFITPRVKACVKTVNVCRLHFSLRIHKLVHICEGYPAELNIFNHIAYFVQ